MKAGGSSTTTSKRSPGAQQLVERIEGIAAQRPDRHAVGARIARGHGQRRLGGVDADRLARAAAHRRDRPGADVAADVEHARTRPQQARGTGLDWRSGRRTSRSSGPWPAAPRSGCRPRAPRCCSGARPIAVRNWRGSCSSSRALPSFFQTSARGRQDLGHGRLHIGAQRFHAGGGDLPDDDVAVAIEHQAGQAVRLAEHQRGSTARAYRRSRSASATFSRCTSSERSGRMHRTSRPRMRAQMSACGLT